MDFAIALLLFTFTLVVYFSYTNNFQKQEKGELDIMLTDAKSISSSLALSGYPPDWDNLTVIRIGILDGQTLNTTKMKSFKQLNYTNAKKIFATQYEYFVFFVDSNKNVLNINSICGVGSPLINVSYKIRAAYYYQDNDDSFLKDFMRDTFSADIYFDDNSNDIHGLYGFVKNLSKYGLIVIEHPAISTSDYNSYKDQLENFTSTGGLFMLSGELVSAQNKDLVGATFKKVSGESSNECPAIVNNTDPYLSFTVGQTMVFDQCYYAKNNTASPLPSADFTRIATFNQTDDKAIARWKYGNGTVYFFSDFDVSNFNGNFVSVVEDATKGFIQGTCTNISVSGLNPKKLVKVERYLNYNSKVVKMVVYLWQ